MWLWKKHTQLLGFSRLALDSSHVVHTFSTVFELLSAGSKFKMKKSKSSPSAEKVAVITGAGSGIGRAISIKLAKQGYSLAITDMNLGTLMMTKGLCTTQGLKPRRVLMVEADLSKIEEIDEIIPKTITEFGRLDILINNVAISNSTTCLEDCQFDKYMNLMRVNVDSVVVMTKQAIPYLEKTKGSIVNTSSIRGLRPLAKEWDYNVSKAALDQFCRSIAIDLAPKGIRVNNVNPGVVLTNWHIPYNPGNVKVDDFDLFLERCGRVHALCRAGNAVEVADLVAFLVSEKAERVTGVCAVVDGGLSAMTWGQS